MNFAKISIAVIIAVCFVIHMYFLIKSETDDKKLKEMIILHVFLYFLSGRNLIISFQDYSIHKFLTLASWILFFYIFYFLFYYDYRKTDNVNIKELTKKEIFETFRKKASENNRIFLKNKPFVITFFMYLALQVILLFIK